MINQSSRFYFAAAQNSHERVLPAAWHPNKSADDGIGPATAIEAQIEPPTPTTTATSDYSAFSQSQKRRVVLLAAFAGWFSTLSSFIYFPAIAALSDALDTTTAKIDLTVTSYLVISAVAPAITGDLADRSGRRPVLIVMLTVYVLTDIGLALQRSYPALLVLRMAQSAGISGTIAVVCGVVADIASPAERGGYMGIVSFCTNTAPALGPLLGALLLSFRGWTAIFWFLGISAGFCLIMIIFFQPETARNIVGNGSIPAYGLHRCPFTRNDVSGEQFFRIEKQEDGFLSPLSCIYRLKDRDTAILITTLSILYMTYTCLQASLATIFIRVYMLNNLQGGLIYLPFGCGCAIAAFGTGKILDRDYRITAKAYGFAVEKGKDTNLNKFPIARARLRSMAYPLSIAVGIIAGYGWSVEYRVVSLLSICHMFKSLCMTAEIWKHMAVPLILQFFTGAMIQSCFTTIMTLLVDLNLDAPSTTQASCNLVRCILAGIGLAALQPVIDAVGVGWYFTIMAISCATPIPFLIIEWKQSMAWRIAKAPQSVSI